MSAASDGPLLELLSAAASRLAVARLGREPLSFGWASVTIEGVQLLPDEVVVQLLARGPMNISARVRAVVLVEAVGASQATLRLAAESDQRTIGQLIEAFIPKLTPRIEELLRQRGIAGVEIHGDRITLNYAPLVASLLAAR